ncbi:MAG: hypothetical protein JWM83_1930 [Candidatus Angelobacter sp.]|nr:hypothetical protein [Candidatus Angelobacter sp.]
MNRAADPIMSANIYASSQLDQVISEVVLPFWRRVQTMVQDQRILLWLARYSRRGEHLKIRIHGEPRHTDLFRLFLEAPAREYFSSKEPAPPGVGKPPNSSAPPIDMEDEAATPATDHTLVWTNYRRTAVSLPGLPWLEDDEFVVRACRCLSAACSRLLDAVESGPLQSTVERQRLLVPILISGAASAGLADHQASEYFRYHRDWLLRFFLHSRQEEQEVLERFESLVAGDSRTVEQLSEFLAEEYDVCATSRREDPWRASVVELASYAGKFAGISDYLTDPFASSTLSVPLFKIFHGAANQLGLPPLQEAYVHHLLLTSQNQSLLCLAPTIDRSGL